MGRGRPKRVRFAGAVAALTTLALGAVWIVPAFAQTADGATAPLPRPRPVERALDTGEAEPGKADGPAKAPQPDDASQPATTAALLQAPPEIAADAGESAPLPRPRPNIGAAEIAALVAGANGGFTPDSLLGAALDAVMEGRYSEGLVIAAGHPDPLASRLVTWMLARRADSQMSAAEIIEVIGSHRGWPEEQRLRGRAESAFLALGPDDEAVLTFYSRSMPGTVSGKLVLARALAANGRRSEAVPMVRELWRDGALSSTQAAGLLARFGSEIDAADHLHRYRRLVLNREIADALVQAQLVGPGYQELARAIVAVLNEEGDAASRLRAVASRFFADPLYSLARAYRLRRAGQPIEAARRLLAMKGDVRDPGDGDVWWDERRDLSRQLVDAGLDDLAYRVTADAAPKDEGDRVEAAFHAGWYALRFLGDPDVAEPHFRELHSLATLPRSQSRASYWLGRTHEAQGRRAAARLDYFEAARFGSTFYGQLAREKLGVKTTGMERLPAPSALDRIRFAENENVKAIRAMAAAGHADNTYPFFEAVAEAAATPGEVTLLVGLARRVDEPRNGMRAAAIAEQRGLAVAALPAPFMGVPPGLRPPDSVDRALVYAVARQESAFNHTARSHVGAQGLMQLMPATARATARSVRLPFSVERLTTDALYNATLGAHHLGELLDRVDRSYILTFVGYNAGPGRAVQWTRAYGDPRAGADPVDWIERIPFDETRNYVQKVMENLQIYRSRIGHPLSLNDDLVRGGPQG